MKPNIKWRDEELPESELFKRKILEFESPLNEFFIARIEAGLYPVLYGWRVRVARLYPGEKHAQSYDMDICCGNNIVHIKMIYGMVLHKIETKYYDLMEEYGYDSPDLLFTQTNIKPIVHDEKFVEWINNCKGYTPASVTREELEEYRVSFMKRVLQRD